MPIVCKSVAKSQEWRGGERVCWTQSRCRASDNPGMQSPAAGQPAISLRCVEATRCVSWRLRTLRRDSLHYSFCALATSRRLLQRIFCICRLPAKNGCIHRLLVARAKKLLMQLRKIFSAFAFNREPWRCVDGCAQCQRWGGRFLRVNRPLHTRYVGKLWSPCGQQVARGTPLRTLKTPKSPANTSPTNPRSTASHRRASDGLDFLSRGRTD